MKNKYQKKMNKQNKGKTNHGLTPLLRIKDPKINPTRRFRLDTYGQQQEKEHTQTNYGRFTH